MNSRKGVGAKICLKLLRGFADETKGHTAKHWPSAVRLVFLEAFID